MISTVNVPCLKTLVLGDITFDQKYRFVAFLTNNVIDEEKLKLIPVEYLTHVVIIMHLLNNESLAVFEALAFTKTLKDVYDNKIPSVLIYPQRIDSRALRTSFLYLTMYYTLTRCLATVGLKSLIVSF